MISAEGELVPLKTRIKPSAVGGAVEKWLIQVWSALHTSSYSAHHDSLSDICTLCQQLSSQLSGANTACCVLQRYHLDNQSKLLAS